jgi:hypothetical protein
VQTHPGSNESVGACENPKYTSTGCRNEMRAYMRIPGGLPFIWGVVPSFQFNFLLAASQKNPISALQKWKKHFAWTKQK